ncbi:MAG: hypothetical protein ACJ780_10320 [Solirubrobacteraceae bacterium]
MPDEDVKVRVTFTYTPDDPDPADDTGMSADEYLELASGLAELGAEDIECKREA